MRSEKKCESYEKGELVLVIRLQEVLVFYDLIYLLDSRFSAIFPSAVELLLDYEAHQA
jgi:hypothetical protein